MATKSSNPETRGKVRPIAKRTQPKSLLAVLATLAPLEDQISRVAELPVDPVEL